MFSFQICYLWKNYDQVMVASTSSSAIRCFSCSAYELLTWQIFSDEVGALVFDPGCSSLRIGYAGEDSPKFDIPASIGVIEDSSEMAESKHFIDTVALSVPRKGKLHIIF